MERYAEIAVRFGERMPVETEGYTERMERFEDALSAFLGGPFEPLMIGFADRLETYAYVEAPSPEEAAGLAIRPFGESAEAVWGPGTTAEVLRVILSKERDRELGCQEAETAPISRPSAPTFGRDWGSEEDFAYDEFAG